MTRGRHDMVVARVQRIRYRLRVPGLHQHGIAFRAPELDGHRHARQSVGEQEAQRRRRHHRRAQARIRVPRRCSRVGRRVAAARDLAESARICARR